jgi:DNA-binding NtrC family response regulator
MLESTNGTHAEAARNIPLMQKKSPIRVLVVDDEPLIRWSLAETLGEAGYEVEEAGDARAAVDAVSGPDGRFDVVLLDFRLPDSNDLKLLARLRALAPGARVILMTAFGTQELVQGALAYGAYRVVSKPFEVREMAALVAEAIAS